jgi:hypothetical protein
MSPTCRPTCQQHVGPTHTCLSIRPFFDIQNPTFPAKKMGEKQDDEETWGLEGGYSSDRGLSRHSLDFHSGKLGEN